VERVSSDTRITKVEFRTDEAKLLGLWMVTRLLGEIRGLEDQTDQAELVTKAQILLTGVRARAGTARFRSDQLGLAESRSRPDDDV
jgi:hypothetical protein